MTTRNQKVFKNAIEKIVDEGFTQFQTIIVNSQQDKRKLNEMGDDSKPNSEPLFEDEEAKSTARMDSEDLDAEDVDQANVDVSGVPNEPVMIQDMCDVAAPVLDQPEIVVLDFEELEVEDTAQSDTGSQLLVVTLLLDELETKDIVQSCVDSRPLAFPPQFHELGMVTNGVLEEYYEVFPLPATYEKKGLHQDMLYGGYDSRLFSSSLSVLLILFHYKT